MMIQMSWPVRVSSSSREWYGGGLVAVLQYGTIFSLYNYKSSGLCSLALEMYGVFLALYVW